MCEIILELRVLGVRWDPNAEPNQAFFLSPVYRLDIVEGRMVGGDSYSVLLT